MTREIIKIQTQLNSDIALSLMINFSESLVSFALENSHQLNSMRYDIRFWSSGERIFAGLEESGSHPDGNFPALRL